MAYPELIIFDCDGVLVDSEMISNQTLADHLTDHGYPISSKRCRERFIGGYLPKMVEQIRAEGVTLPDDFIPNLRKRDTEAFKNDLQPVPGIHIALKGLLHKKCVASSGPPEKIRNNLTTTSLLDHFAPHLYSGYDVERPKPAPDLFLHAAQKLDIQPADCLVIEDSKFGIMAARAAGMTVFGYVGASHCDDLYIEHLARQEPDLIFSDMETLPDLIANWAPAS